jgi:flagellar export protein FliJ
MGFRFSLATVLRFRESVEKREELALQRLLLESARIRREIEHVTQEIAGAHEAKNEAMLQALAAVDLQTMLNEIDAVANRKKALVESLVELDRERAIQTKKYQAAHRDRQMLSDMCSRQLDAYEQEHARAQQKFLDDIFAARAQRG